MKQPFLHQPTRRAGFTLVELSIVLVIIGLIAGGILLGRELIRQAEIRAQIKQIEQYDLAFATFRNKYGAVPGDLKAQHAAELGFVARSGADGHGDGDEKVENCTPGSTYLGCETLLVWTDLSQAAFIPASFTTATDGPIDVPAGSDRAKLYFPSPIIKPIASMWAVTDFYGASGTWLVMYRILLATGSSMSSRAEFFPVEIHAIDSKIDDGMGISGRVQVFTSLGGWFGEPTLGNNCLNSDGTYYILTPASDPPCFQVNVRLSSVKY